MTNKKPAKVWNDEIPLGFDYERFMDRFKRQPQKPTRKQRRLAAQHARKAQRK